MRRSGFLPLAVVAACVATVAPASAQSGLVVTPYVGVWMVDDDLSDFEFEPASLDPDPAPVPSPRFSTEVETGLLIGFRVGVPVGQRWIVEGSYGYSSFDTDASVEFDDAFPESELFSLKLLEHSAHLFHGAIRWNLSPDARVHPYLVGGLGAVRMTSSAAPLFGFEDEEAVLTATDLMLTVGGGVAVPLRPGVSIRAELRDDLQFCDELCPEGDRTLHHLELTGGLEIEL